MRVSALRAALLAAPFAMPLPAAAGAFLTFSGVVYDGIGSNMFGLGEDSDLSGLAFSGSLRAGGAVGRANDFAFDQDNEYLVFNLAGLTFTLNGVTESAQVAQLPGELPFEIGVFNGFNPRFGLADGCCDDVTVVVFGGSATAVAAIEIEIVGDAEAVPGGLTPFSVATDGVLINGGVFALLIVGPGDSRGFFLTATDFTLELVSVPAPGGVALFGAGLLGLLGLAHRRCLI